MIKAVSFDVMKFIMIAGFALISAQISVHSAQAKDATVAPVQMVPASFADLAERLSPAVVNISTTQKTTMPRDFPEMPQFPEGSPFQDFFEEFMERNGRGAPSMPNTSLGSGFIIDAENGYVVTNNHVIRDADEVKVILSNDTSLSAEVIGVDEKTDLAVLKVDTKDHTLVAVPFGDSDKSRVGDWIMAIGNPFGLGGSVTTGILSARARDIDSGPYDDFLQTDASINRGNSGGPMFNMHGEVIGINTAIFSPTGGSVGIGFAIPSALAVPVVNQIIKYGRTRRGWLGVRIQTVTEEIAESLGLGEPRGALVATVTKDGPAEKAGLEGGDVIIEFNGNKIEEMKMLPRFVAETDIESEATVKYWREGKEYSAKVKVGELEKAEEDGLVPNADDKPQSSGKEVESVGLTLKLIEDQDRTAFQIPNDVKGVLIFDVKQASEAENKGLDSGDVIVEINQQPVEAPEDVIDIIEKAQANARKSVLLLINRGGDVRFVALRLDR